MEAKDMYLSAEKWDKILGFAIDDELCWKVKTRDKKGSAILCVGPKGIRIVVDTGEGFETLETIEMKVIVSIANNGNKLIIKHGTQLENIRNDVYKTKGAEKILGAVRAQIKNQLERMQVGNTEEVLASLATNKKKSMPLRKVSTKETEAPVIDDTPELAVSGDFLNNSSMKVISPEKMEGKRAEIDAITANVKERERKSSKSITTKLKTSAGKKERSPRALTTPVHVSISDPETNTNKKESKADLIQLDNYESLESD